MVITSVYPVTSGADDGSFSSNTNTALRLWWLENSFIRFSSVTIPRGSIITDAYMSVYVAGYDNIQTVKHSDIYFEDADNPSAVISDVDGNSRVKTTNYRLMHTYAGLGWYPWDTLTPIIQEVVDRPGWSSGNAMQALIFCTDGSGSYVYLHSYDGYPTRSATLTVSFTPPPPISGGVQIVGLEAW